MGGGGFYSTLNFSPYTLTPQLQTLLQSLVQCSNTALWIHGDHRVNAVAINIKGLVDATTNVGGKMRRATSINNTNANGPATATNHSAPLRIPL